MCVFFIFSETIYTPPNHEYIGEGICKDSASNVYSYVDESDTSASSDATACGEFCDTVRGLGTVDYRGFDYKPDTYCHCQFDPVSEITLAVNISWYAETYPITSNSGTAEMTSFTSSAGSFCFKGKF